MDEAGEVFRGRQKEPQKQITNENLLCRELYAMLYGDLNGKEIKKKGNTQLIHFSVEQK